MGDEDFHQVSDTHLTSAGASSTVALEYRSPRTTPPLSAVERWARAFLIGVLAPLMTFTCVRIEILNARVGGILPRTSGGKWRAPYERDEVRWRRLHAEITGDPTVETRPLTSDEAELMRVEVQHAQAGAALRDIVGTWGLLQYPVVLVMLISSVGLLAEGRSRRWVTLACVLLVATLACGGLMIHRAYFTSLGD